ncbi:MAG: polysaccharide biosynthesis tyrosine autokinase [Oscillospiraceae bacterium]|nr:polysaccharide biosynthesis tyrosine autokinase [Oscillospiraceae bacterium]
MNEKKSSGMMDFNLAVVLHNFFGAAKRLIWFAVALAIGAGVFIYYRTNRSYTPVYSSSVVFSVHASYATTTDIITHSAWLDANAAEMLSKTFPYIIRSENTKMLLQLELGRPVNGSITAVATADTGLFTMTATSSNAQDAFDLMNAAITVYPQAASNVLGDTQIYIINRPLTPPAEPDNGNNAIAAGLRAAIPIFLLGVVAIFLLSLTRKTVHSAEDLRKLVSLKCLAYVPSVKMKKHSNRSNLTLTITNPRVVSTFNESIRNLRIKVQKLLWDKNQQILLITSTLPNEGKTTVATNLALSLAQEGKKVILIDGDLRKQSLKETIGVTDPSDGLPDLLSGTSDNFRLLTVPNSTLLLLSGDNTVDQPQALIDTPRMKQVLDLLRERMDYIIIDSPPAGIMSDAATLAKYADATLYIVRQDMASTQQIATSIQTLSTNDINLIGCVLNQTQAGTTRYGYGSKYNAGYGYSYGYKYSSNSYGYGRKRYSRYDDAADTAEELTQQINEAASGESETDKDD